MTKLNLNGLAVLNLKIRLRKQGNQFVLSSRGLPDHWGFT